MEATSRESFIRRARRRARPTGEPHDRTAADPAQRPAPEGEGLRDVLAEPGSDQRFDRGVRHARREVGERKQQAVAEPEGGGEAGEDQA